MIVRHHGYCYPNVIYYVNIIMLHSSDDIILNVASHACFISHFNHLICLETLMSSILALSCLMKLLAGTEIKRLFGQNLKCVLIPISNL